MEERKLAGLINVGFGNVVNSSKVVAIINPESAPIKRLIQNAKDRGMTVDATQGRRTRAVIITEDDYVILSALQPETITNRYNSIDSKGENHG